MSKRTAVVSGGGTGIGLAVAQALVDDDYTVALLGRRPAVLEAAAEQPNAPTRVVTQAIDLADPLALTKAMPVIIERLGGTLDVVVANAGSAPPAADNSLVSVNKAWHATLTGNTITTVLLIEALRAHLSDTARLIFISSAAAIGPGGGPYGAAKAALHGWMYDLAVELGPIGVTCNIVAPGFIADTGLLGDRMTAERRASLVERTLVKRVGRPSDVADCVRWLARPESGYVTSQIIGIDGGALVDPG
jgi:3-oxoacyl-[acyl-carrier protein] reductase